MPVTLSGVNLTFVAIVGVIAVIALVMAMVFRREVLAANDGTANMQAIARAVQEGASAYLARQFRTLGVFAVAAFFLLLAAAGARQRRVRRLDAEDRPLDRVPGRRGVLRV